jgi:unsaturated chondroitin disaccharide hydrolase
MADQVFRRDWQAALDSLCLRVCEIRASIGDAWPLRSPRRSLGYDRRRRLCGGHWVECLRIVGELIGDGLLEAESSRRAERSRPFLGRDDMFKGGAASTMQPRANMPGRDRRGSAHLRSQLPIHCERWRCPRAGAMPIGTQVQVRPTRIFGRDAKWHSRDASTPVVGNRSMTSASSCSETS